MKDRLRELRALQGEDASELEPVLYHQNGDSHSKHVFMNEFYEQINELKIILSEVKRKIQEIKKSHSIILSSPQPDEKIKDELEKLVNDVQAMILKLKTNVKNIDKSSKQDSTAFEGNDVELRIKKSLQATLSKELMDAMTEYDIIQKDFKNCCKNRIKRQLQIVNPDSPIVEDEKFERMIESGNVSVFTQGIMTETQQAKNSLRDIEARHYDIIKLESSIKQLHELFTDVAYFVQSQGEMIESILYHVEGATAYVETAVRETRQARDYANKARKKKIFCALCGLILFIVIACAVYFSIVE